MSQTVAVGAAPGTAAIQGELWGERAHDYAEVQEPTFLPLYQSVLARIELGNARSLLDIGCGPGLAVETFGKAIAKVAGVDACAPFIEIARRRQPNGEFNVTEMEELPYTPETFDVVTGFNAFQYAASPQNALREAHRVAKTGAHVVIAVWGPPEKCQAAGHLKAMGALMPPPPPGAPGPFALSDQTRLRELATSAGLRPLDIVDVDCPWIYPDLDTALRGMLSSGPATRAIRNAGFERVRDAVEAAIAPYRTLSGGYRLENVFRYLITRT